MAVSLDVYVPCRLAALAAKNSSTHSIVWRPRKTAVCHKNPLIDVRIEEITRSPRMTSRPTKTPDAMASRPRRKSIRPIRIVIAWAKSVRRYATFTRSGNPSRSDARKTECWTHRSAAQAGRRGPRGARPPRTPTPGLLRCRFPAVERPRTDRRCGRSSRRGRSRCPAPVFVNV
jgi:hypothetical protein